MQNSYPHNKIKPNSNEIHPNQLDQNQKKMLVLFELFYPMQEFSINFTFSLRIQTKLIISLEFIYSEIQLL